MDKKTLKEIGAFVAEFVELYDLKKQIAIYYMETDRCPLRVASPTLYDEIVSAIEEYVSDNEEELTEEEVQEIEGMEENELEELLWD